MRGRKKDRAVIHNKEKEKEEGVVSALVSVVSHIEKV
jgi:hypothetical protein